MIIIFLVVCGYSRIYLWISLKAKFDRLLGAVIRPCNTPIDRQGPTYLIFWHLTPTATLKLHVPSRVLIRAGGDGPGSNFNPLDRNPINYEYI